MVRSQLPSCVWKRSDFAISLQPFQALEGMHAEGRAEYCLARLEGQNFDATIAYKEQVNSMQ
jgi:hypothetical protein